MSVLGPAAFPSSQEAGQFWVFEYKTTGGHSDAG
jgi:hypothetical protein